MPVGSTSCRTGKARPISEFLTLPNAIGALGEIGDRVAVPHLQPYLSDPRWYRARLPAICALLMIDDHHGREAAASQLARETWRHRHQVRAALRRNGRRAARRAARLRRRGPG